MLSSYPPLEKGRIWEQCFQVKLRFVRPTMPPTDWVAFFVSKLRQHKTNEYVWHVAIGRYPILAGRQELLLLSSVASYHGSVMSVVMMSCRRYSD